MEPPALLAWRDFLEEKKRREERGEGGGLRRREEEPLSLCRRAPTKGSIVPFFPLLFLSREGSKSKRKGTHPLLLLSSFSPKRIVQASKTFIITPHYSRQPAERDVFVYVCATQVPHTCISMCVLAHTTNRKFLRLKSPPNACTGTASPVLLSQLG